MRTTAALCCCLLPFVVGNARAAAPSREVGQIRVAGLSPRDLNVADLEMRILAARREIQGVAPCLNRGSDE
jgi:hypothetical protein